MANSQSLFVATSH